MNNVVPMTPKTINKRYKNHKITITFRTEDRRWIWEVEYVEVMKFSDVADTMRDAHRNAEKHIDKTLKIKGQE